MVMPALDDHEPEHVIREAVVRFLHVGWIKGARAIEMADSFIGDLAAGPRREAN